MNGPRRPLVGFLSLAAMLLASLSPDERGRHPLDPPPPPPPPPSPEREAQGGLVPAGWGCHVSSGVPSDEDRKRLEAAAAKRQRKAQRRLERRKTER